MGSVVLLRKPGNPPLPPLGEEIGGLDLGVDGHQVFECERVVGLELERFPVQARGRRQVGEGVLHREEESLSSRVAWGPEDGDRHRLARDVERDGAPGAGAHVLLRAAQVGLVPRDQVLGKGSRSWRKRMPSP